MAIKTNAKDKESRDSVRAFINSVDAETRRRKITLEFNDGTVTINDGDSATSMSHDAFKRWEADGFPYGEDGPKIPNNAKTDEGDFRPQPKPTSKKAAAKKAPAKKRAPTKKAPAKKAPVKKTEPKPKGAVAKARAEASTVVAAQDDLIEAFAAEAFEISNTEHSGEVGRNAARFRRGELMIRLHGAAKSARIPVKKMLANLNDRMVIIAGERGVPDFGEITEQEASTTRKVVEAFGSDTDFRLAHKINPTTGQPLVRDDGNPFELHITEVAMNKLAPLTEFADSIDLDTLISFAYLNTEKVVKGAKRVATRTGAPMRKVVDKLLSVTEQSVSPLAPELGEIKINASERTLLQEISNMLGEAPPVEVATIKTDKNWYESFWVPLKNLMSQLARLYKPDATNQTTGEVSNVFVLERTIGQFFNVNDDAGIQRALGAMVEAQDLSEDQANDFLSRYAFNQESGAWVELQPGENVVVEADALDEDLDEDELDDDDPDFDIDTGEEEEDEDSEFEEDED